MITITGKKALVVSAPTSFSALAFREGIVEGMQMAGLLGYNAVELAVRDPRLLDTAAVISASRKLSLPVVALGTGQAFVEEGLSLTSVDKDLRRRALERLRSHIELAASLGVQEQPLVIVGLIRGGRLEDGLEKTVALRMLADGLLEVCRVAWEEGIDLVLEPVNRYESDLINTASEGLTLIEEIGCKNLQLLMDTFHMNIEEANMEQSLHLVTDAGRLGHIHLADSNRRAPGDGHIDFKTLLGVSRERGYRGALSMEIMPLPSSREAAQAALAHLNKLGF